MPRQQSRGAPSAPPPIPSPNSSQPPPIIVLPPGESHAARNAPTATQYGEASTLVSQNPLHQGVYNNQYNLYNPYNPYIQYSPYPKKPGS